MPQSTRVCSTLPDNNRYPYDEMHSSHVVAQETQKCGENKLILFPDKGMIPRVLSAVKGVYELDESNCTQPTRHFAYGFDEVINPGLVISSFMPGIPANCVI